LYALVIVNLF